MSTTFTCPHVHLIVFLFGSFIPSISQIASDLHSTPAVVSSTISVSTFGTAIGMLFWGAYSSYYGRRLMYLFSTPCIIFGSFGSGFSSTVVELLVWRFIQAFGAGCGMSVGTAVVGDIYKIDERGAAMGIFLAVSLIGPAIAPLGGGLATHLASWRVMQYALGFASILTMILVATFLPETSQPGCRGVDKAAEGPRRLRFVWVNPFSSLALLRSPLVIIHCIISSFVLLTDFVLWVPLPFTIGERYGITNEALIGLCFLPSGIGNIIGAPVIGRLSDRSIKHWRIQRSGKWCPEDRIRVTVFGALVLVPVSVLLAGLASTFVDGALGVLLCLTALLMNGIGVVIVLAPLQAYMVDILHDRSAEAASASHGARTLLCSLLSLGVMPSIEYLGVLRTDLLSALIAWIGGGLLLYVIQNGDYLRNLVDIGFTTMETN
ncbi:MFS general substrate transporter [Phlebopus sp. FC_14]|nr:MFS general substrate transporter [Phlebopus sp. FC_14]